MSVKQNCRSMAPIEEAKMDIFEMMIARGRRERTWQRANGNDDRKVYFILSTNGTIKIGISQTPEWRIKDLQRDRDDRLTLLGVCEGGLRKEQALHKEFAAYRVRGEWFNQSDELWAKIFELTGCPCPNLPPMPNIV